MINECNVIWSCCTLFDRSWEIFCEWESCYVNSFFFFLTFLSLKSFFKSAEWMDRPAVGSAPTEGQLEQQNEKTWTDFWACNNRAAECLKQAFTQAPRSSCSHEPADFKHKVLGHSQPLALVYFHQIVIFHLTQRFASSNWSNSSPLTTWAFLVYVWFLRALWCKCLPPPVGEKFKYITNEDTEMLHFISKSDIPPLLGS